MDEIRPYNIYLPEFYDATDTSKRFPVVYYLHASQTDHHYRFWGLEEVLRDSCGAGAFKQMIIVAPYGFMNPQISKLPWIETAYTNSELHGNYEDLIAIDLVAHIDSNFNTIPSREKRAIMGFSIGGYGAFKLSFKNPQIYCGLASFDGYVSVTNTLFEQWWRDEIISDYRGTGPFNPNAGTMTNLLYADAGSFSPNLDNPPYFVDLPIDTSFTIIDSVFDKWKLHNITHLASESAFDPNFDIYFDSMTEGDNFSNNELKDQLSLLGIPYLYNEYVGGHLDMLHQRRAMGLSFLDSIIWKEYPRTYNTTLSSHYAIPQKDTVNIVTRFTNPKDHSLETLALIVGEDGSVEETMNMIANSDKEMVCEWQAFNGEENFRIDFIINDLTSPEMSHRIYNQSYVTTVGPLELTSCEMVRVSDLNKIRIGDITVTNQSIQRIVKNVSVKITSSDTSVISITGIKNYGDLEPKQTKKVGGGIYVEADTIKGFTFIAEISSGNKVNWKDTLYFDPTVDVEEEFYLPLDFALKQNYPNPFNPSTKISYSIPEQSYVSLKLFDVLAREVVTLVNKEQPVGNYEVEFDASSLTSGIYFYRIQAGEFVDTKKMLLLK